MVKCSKDQVERLQKALKREKNSTSRQRIQMVLLREDGMTQPKIAELTGMSLSTVNRAHMAYDNGGVNALRRKPTGGRRRENMTLEEEKAFLATFAKAPGAGQLLNVQELKSAYEKQIGHETSTTASRSQPLVPPEWA
jgi:transposase